MVTFIGLIFWGRCSEAEAERIAFYTYDQTVCNDAWGYSRKADLEIDKMKLFLRENGVEQDSLDRIDDPDPEICDSCWCNTGIRFRVWADEAFHPLLDSLGFEPG